MISPCCSVIVSPVQSEVGDNDSTHSPVGEASSTTGDLDISNEDLALMTDIPFIKFPLENVESSVMEIDEYRNDNLRIKYSKDMVPASYEDCSRVLLEVLVHHYDITSTYSKLFGNLVTKHQSPACFAEINL